MDGIREVSTPIELAHARELIREYAASLDTDLCFQGFESEMANLPGSYARPRGCLLLAWHDERPAGCVAMRELKPEVKSGAKPDVAELKRLYVRPFARGFGLGRSLTERVIGEARQAGYRGIVLDTLAGMAHAQDLYRRLGFREIEPYYDNPIPGARYLRLDL
ncbi:MAG: GNAT family N-acetyltransferase [Burkholderiales bacterium]